MKMNIRMDWGGLEPPTSPMPREHSTPELPAQQNIFFDITLFIPV